MRPSRSLAVIQLATLAFATGFVASPTWAVSAQDVASAIEAAHGKSAWYAKDAVEVDIHVQGFGGLELEGTMLFTPSLGEVRFELVEGTTLIYNRGDAWMTPSDADMSPAMARFHVLTWPYFVAVPFKINDPGVHLGEPVPMPVTHPDDTTTAVQMTFGQGVGDAPDDWYYLLPNDDGVLEALSYIVTYGKPQDDAEEQPSIVLYDDFRTIDGVTLPFHWEFHYWHKDSGVAEGEPKGTARIQSVRFVTPPADAFEKPANATPLPAPAS